MVDCGFCNVDDGVSWVLFHMPGNVLLPHLLHFLAVGMATSETVGGWEVGRWRLRALVGAGALGFLDGYLLLGYDQAVDVNGPPPLGMFWVMGIMRPVVLCLFDVLLAGVLWASATQRLLMFSGPTLNDEEARRRNMEMLNGSNVTLQTAQTKLRAANVVRECGREGQSTTGSGGQLLERGG